MTQQTVEKTHRKPFKPVAVARRARRAYFGLFGLAYDRAQFRYDQARTLTDGLFEDLMLRGANIEGKAVETITGGKDKVLRVLPKGDTHSQIGS